MEKIQTIISVTTSIITFVTLVYKLGIKSGRKKEITYYNKLLKPFVAKIKSKEKVDAISVVKEMVELCDDNIPRYVYYLIESKRSDELKKVLLYDYISLYPNDENSLDRIMDYISKSGYYVLAILSFLSMILGTCFVSTSASGMLLCIFDGEQVMMKLGNNMVIDWAWFLCNVVIGVIAIAIGIIFIKMTFALETDRYSIKKEKVQKAIKKKIDKYEKKCKRYVI